MLILWTDTLIFLLVFCSLLLIIYLTRQQHFRRPLTKLSNNTVAMVSLTLLMYFVFIGLADSVHFKSNDNQSAQALSVLDMMLDDIRQNSEKTYSAPFSAYLYSKENISANDGSNHWDYPRLKHGGAHLQDPDREKTTDIALHTITALAKAIIFFSLSISLIWFFSRQTFFWQAPSIRAVIWTTATIASISYTLLSLSDFYHVFGTDKVGEDVLYQTLKSIRTGLVIGSLTTLIMLPFAIVFGIMAGYFKGWIDDVIQFIYTTLNSIPSVLLIAASILMVQVYMSNHAENFNNLLVRADLRLLFLCLILGVTSWTGLCRMLRAETLKLREMEFVLAAKSLGVKPTIILFRHILPNVMHIVLISVVLDFSALVLAEVVLSYINIGVDPTTHSWGNMINSARMELARDPVVWWSLLAAFTFMFTLVLAANLFADSVRDAFDPRRVS